jgi:hypothetical protein
MEKGEIVIYQPTDNIRLEVRIEDETVWLNRQQIAVLFDRDVKTIGKHVNNALAQELKGEATIANFATVQKEGGRLVTRGVEYYNLDMILSIGYRVKSQRGIDFRKWANKVLKEYILRGYAVSQRIERLEQRVTKTEEKIDFFVRTSLPPVEGVFYDGQIFDAHVFVSNLIKSAKQRIILIDNYLDESVLVTLSKREVNVTAKIITKSISNQFQTDLNRYNSQYSPIDVEERDGIHDRFLIIDDTLYHLGASLKDLGKKLFAFSKMELSSETILGVI